VCHRTVPEIVQNNPTRAHTVWMLTALCQPFHSTHLLILSCTVCWWNSSPLSRQRENSSSLFGQHLLQNSFKGWQTDSVPQGESRLKASRYDFLAGGQTAANSSVFQGLFKGLPSGEGEGPVCVAIVRLRLLTRQSSSGLSSFQMVCSYGHHLLHWGFTGHSISGHRRCCYGRYGGTVLVYS